MLETSETGEKLVVAIICRDDCCALGEWLHGVGQTLYGTRFEFQNLLDKHKNFHFVTSIGNVMWLMGGPIAGGKVHGIWPGLSPAALYEGRDLAVTTDFRQVISEVVHEHLLLQDSKVQDVFPMYTGTAQNRLGLIRT